MATVSPIVTIPTANYGFPGQTNLPMLRPTQLFSYTEGDVLSMLAEPMSKLYRWVPSFATSFQTMNDKHFSFLVPEGFDGSETYLEYIMTEDPPGLCNFASASVEYNICEWFKALRRLTISNEDQPLTQFAGGNSYYASTQPRYVMQGPGAGQLMINNDRDWILSTLTWRMQSHLQWNLIHGTELVDTTLGSFDGLRRVLTIGYIKSKKIGQGSCVWTDPIVVPGADFDTPELAAWKARWIWRRILQRMNQRGYTPAFGDVVMTGPRAHFHKMWDKIATGIFSMSDVTGVDFQNFPDVWQRERDRLATPPSAEYDGIFPIDPGVNIPVIFEDSLGHNTTATDGSPAITGDLLFLTRRYRGLNILYHEYLDMSQASWMPSGNNGTFFQDGMVQSGYEEVRNCYWYWEQLYGTLTSRMQPLQGRMVDVTLSVDDDLEQIESGNFFDPNFYPYEGAQYDTGTPILEGL